VFAREQRDVDRIVEHAPMRLRPISSSATCARKQGIELGCSCSNDAIDITLFAREHSVDVPELALNQFQGKFPSLPTSWLQSGCDP